MSCQTLTNVEPSRFIHAKTIIAACVLVCAFGIPSADARHANDSRGVTQAVNAMHIRSVALNQRYHLPRQPKHAQLPRRHLISETGKYDSLCPCNADLPHRLPPPAPPCPCNADLPSSATR